MNNCFPQIKLFTYNDLNQDKKNIAAIVITPIDIPVVRVNAYAKEETGDTPRFACIEKLTPSERKNKPKIYKIKRLTVILM